MARLRPGEGWERALYDLLRLRGWEWMHVVPAYVPGRNAPITPMRGPAAKGWPDLTAEKPGRFLLAEAKSGAATLTALQRARLQRIDSGGVVEAYLFREADLSLIAAVLEGDVRPDLPDGVRRRLQPWRFRRSRLDPPEGRLL